MAGLFGKYVVSLISSNESMAWEHLSDSECVWLRVLLRVQLGMPHFIATAEGCAYSAHGPPAEGHQAGVGAVQRVAATTAERRPSSSFAACLLGWPHCLVCRALRGSACGSMQATGQEKGQDGQEGVSSGSSSRQVLQAHASSMRELIPHGISMASTGGRWSRYYGSSLRCSRAGNCVEAGCTAAGTPAHIPVGT